jgi:hypothetical protein
MGEAMEFEQEAKHANRLSGFNLMGADLSQFDVGISNAVNTMKFIGFMPNNEGKREYNGLIVVAVPWEISSEAEPDVNPIQFFYDYTLQASSKDMLVTDPNILEKIPPFHAIACLNLPQFVAVVEKYIGADTAGAITNSEAIREGLAKLSEKAKAANFMPPEEFDAWLQKSIMEHKRGAGRKRKIELD